MYDELDYDALLGDDIEYFEPETEIIGRRRGRARPTPFARGRGRGRSRGRSSRGRSPAGYARLRAPAATRALMAGNIAPGVPRTGAAVLALGFGNFQIVGAATTVTVNIRPQRPILVRRLSIVTFDSAPAMIGQDLVTAFTVGVNSQLVGTSGIPIEAFGPLATDIVLAGDVATPGVDVSLTITRTVAPGAPQFVNYAAVLFGESLT